ncbi:NAD-dependent epimerase/dehydratase family protein [Bosea thiooxidans]
MTDKLHILVTGASGFVGRVLVRMAQAKGHRVVALVRDSAQTPAGSDALIHELGSGAKLELPSGVNAVVHLAQSRVYRAFPGDAGEMYRVNVAGTQDVLVAAAEAGVSRLCVISSGTVYEPFSGELAEHEPLAPVGNLGATKLAAEVLARPYSALFPVSILRLFAPYGPGQTARLIPDLIKRVRSGEVVTLPSSGGGLRFAPTYVDDICDVILAALQDSWKGEFNVASPEALTIEDVARGIAAALGKEPRFERKEMSVPSLVPSLAKFGAQYDLSRFRSFAEGIAATVAGEH